jgi:hypothetical protein
MLDTNSLVRGSDHTLWQKGKGVNASKLSFSAGRRLSFFRDRSHDKKFILFPADPVVSSQALYPQDLLSRSDHNNGNIALGRFVAGHPSTVRSQNGWLLAQGSSGTEI